MKPARDQIYCMDCLELLSQVPGGHYLGAEINQDYYDMVVNRIGEFGREVSIGGPVTEQ